jgi:hypothetical protein
MWKNTARPGMRFACSVPKTANKQPEYVIIIAFPLQQWLHERVSMLNYMYIDRLDTNAAASFHFYKLAFPYGPRQQ